MEGTLLGNARIRIRADASGMAQEVDREVKLTLKKSSVTLNDVVKATAASIGKITKGGFAALGSQAAVGGLVAVAGAASQAAGAIALVPAAAVAAAAPVAALKIGVTGMGDAMKAVAEGDAAALDAALSKLAPSAQATVRAVAAVKPAFDDLRLDVQQQLFEGLGARVQSLAGTYLPIARESLRGFAADINYAGHQVAAFFELPATAGDITVLLENSRVAFGNVVQAARPLVQAMTDIAVVGSSFLPGLTSGLGGAATKFAEFIGHARESGQLAGWIETGIDTLSVLGGILGNVGSIIHSVFSAGAAVGGGFLQTLRDVTGQVATFLASPVGQSQLATFFQSVGAAVSALAPLLITAGSILLGTVGPALANFAELLAPIAHELLVALGAALERIVPVLPQLAATMSTVVAAFLPLVPVVADLVVNLLPPLLSVITAIAPALPAIAGGVAAVVGVMRTWAIVQGLLNAVIQANPIMRVVGIITFLVGALITAYQTSEEFRNIVDGAFRAVGDAASWLWEKLSAAFTWIKDAFTGLASSFWTKATEIKDSVVTRFTELRDGAVSLMTNAKDWVVERLTGLRDGAVNIIQNAKDWIVDRFRGMRDDVVGMAQNIWEWVTDKFTRVKDDAIGLFRDMAQGIGEKWDEIKKKTAEPINFVIETVLNNGLFKAFNTVKEKLGLDFADLHIDPIKLATGGRVPGSSPTPTADNIPAMLTAGEYVHPVNSVRHYGSEIMEGIRSRRIPKEALQNAMHLADGGLVALGKRLQGMGATVSRHPAFGGAVRSGHGKNSLHYQDRAIDVNTRPGTSVQEQRELDPMAALARSLGFRTIWRTKDHFNHLHIDDGGGASIGGGGGTGGAGLLGGLWDTVTAVWNSIKDSITDPVRQLKEKFGDSDFLKIAAATPGYLSGQIWEKVKGSVQGVWDSLQETFSLGDDDTGGGSPDVREAVRKVAEGFGWGSGDQWLALSKLIHGESGWNPKAANPTSSARGLFQKMTSLHGPLEPTVAGQARWGLTYIQGAYGTPAKAYAKWMSRSPHWYSQGGPVKAGVFDTGGLLYDGQMAVNLSGKPERVLDPIQTEKLDEALSGGRRGGGDQHIYVTVDPSKGDARGQIEEVAFQLRRLQRGAHAY